MEKKILSKEIQTRDGALSLARAVKENPKKANQLMKKDYSKFESTEEIKNQIRKIVPNYTETPLKDAFAQSRKPSEYLADITSEIIKWLEEHPPEGVGTFYLHGVVEDLVITRREIERWLKGSKPVKKLKEKN